LLWTTLKTWLNDEEGRGGRRTRKGEWFDAGGSTFVALEFEMNWASQSKAGIGLLKCVSENNKKL
jgi:hypothetical protein